MTSKDKANKDKPFFYPLTELKKVNKIKNSKFSDKYLADDNGTVYIRDFNTRSRIINGKKHVLVKNMKSFKTRIGYIEYVLTDIYGIKKHLQAHRIVATLYKPNPKNLPHVNHDDGDKTNNNKSNLSWMSVSENNLHRVAMQKKNFKNK